MTRPRFIALLLVLGTLAVYLPAAHDGFTLYDDSDYVTENSVVQRGLTWDGFLWAFGWHACNWHPLTWLSHMLDCQLFGARPESAGMHHSVNVLFHAANSALLFWLLLAMLSGGRRNEDEGWKMEDGKRAPSSSLFLWPSAFAAALFAWHPLHVESVAWISERKDVLSTFFALLTLLAYTRHVTSGRWQVTEKTANSMAVVSPVTCHLSLIYWLALIFFALALMAKPMMVTLPCVMLLMDFWPLRRMSLSAFRFPLLFEKWPFFALTAASCAVTFLAQRGAEATLKNVPLDYRLENTPVAYAAYLFKMVWPAKLAIFYPLNSIPPLTVAASVLALIAISWLVWRARRPAPYWLIGWLWFLGTLVPVIGLVQVGGAALADRYTYFPSIGIFLAVALGIRDAAERFRISKSIVAAGAGLILAACLALTHRQLNFWQDDITLFRHAIKVTKDNDTAHLNLGFALEKAGEKTEALEEYRAAQKLDPDRAETHNNIANLLDDLGRTDEALAEYQEALRINPNHAPSHNNYGTMLAELGRFDDAMKQYTNAASLDPNDWHAPYLIGKLLLKEGRDPEAVPYFKKAVQLAPNNPRVLTYLAQVLASDENPQVRNGNAALMMAAKANDLTGDAQPAMIDAMAMAYAEMGQFTNAQQSAAYALKLATAYEMTNDVVLIGQRLQLYQSNQPFRQSFLFTNAPADGSNKN